MGNAKTKFASVFDKGMNCDICHQKMTSCAEYYPHEQGGYCFFAPRDIIYRVCIDCVTETCADCGKELPLHLCVDCKGCNKIHCWNNTDIKYQNVWNLCKSRHCNYPSEHNSKNGGGDGE